MYFFRLLHDFMLPLAPGTLNAILDKYAEHVYPECVSWVTQVTLDS